LKPVATPTDWLRQEDEGALRWLTLDRPAVRNAIPPSGWADLEAAFHSFESSPARVLIVSGAGGAFCSGADLSAIDPTTGAAEFHRMSKQAGSAAWALHRITKPTIAAVGGIAAGAGMNLALGCDMVVASTAARFAELFVRRGLTVDFGGTWLLPRIVGPQRAKELALSGRIVEADEALALGLCLEVVEPEALQARARELAESFLTGSPTAQMFTKQGLDGALESSFGVAVSAEVQAQAVSLGSPDAAEGVAAFREKREPRFGGV
jgi:2-(1,2-epoxy-1,2-dihydrophenyl)acetyl-CoA isomerase